MDIPHLLVKRYAEKGIRAVVTASEKGGFTARFPDRDSKTLADLDELHQIVGEVQKLVEADVAELEQLCGQTAE